MTIKENMLDYSGILYESNMPKVTLQMWNKNFKKLAMIEKEKYVNGLDRDDFFDEYSPSPETPPYELGEFFNSEEERAKYYYKHVKC